MKRTESIDYFRSLLKTNDVLLAPMAGVTDAAFRHVCAKNGAHVMFTEMVSAKGMVYGNKNTGKLLYLGPGENNTAVQIFGEDETFLSRAVGEYLNDSAFAFIDINMGCPVKKVTSNGEGSALLRNTEKLYRVAKSVVDASDKPVSAKIRLGIDGRINACENVQALEEAGVGMVTVHGRTAEMFYSGHADYSQISLAVKTAKKIPVIANGDVGDYSGYLKIMADTGAAGAMIGRAAMGNPFVFSEIATLKNGEAYIPPTNDEKLTTALEHFEFLLKYKGEHTACSEFRRHFCYYTKGMPGGAALRSQISSYERAEQFTDLIKSLTDRFKNEESVCPAEP